jgi:hypothetical protein
MKTRLIYELTSLLLYRRSDPFGDVSGRTMALSDANSLLVFDLATVYLYEFKLIFEYLNL